MIKIEDRKETHVVTLHHSASASGQTRDWDLRRHTRPSLYKMHAYCIDRKRKQAPNLVKAL